jgi:hypothetical protein
MAGDRISRYPAVNDVIHYGAGHPDIAGNLGMGNAQPTQAVRNFEPVYHCA